MMLVRRGEAFCNDTAADGSRCGGRSAASRPGGGGAR